MVAAPSTSADGSSSVLVRRSSQPLDLAADTPEHAPPRVLALARAAPDLELDLERARLRSLISPLAGTCAGALEIALTWPMEWAKVQSQLHRFDPRWSLLAQARASGTGIYKGLPPMLLGAPLQGAVRFSTLEQIRGALAAPGEAPGPGTNLAAGVLAGALEATLVVTPVETVKTRLVDADKAGVESSHVDHHHM